MSTKYKDPLVSICVPCYNHEKYIPYFMESILSQDYTNWELIITDDCSTDNSYKILKSYNDKRIKIYRNDKNRHLCDTMNNSFKHASGKYVCVMYSDDAMCPGKLSHDVKFMELNKDIAVLYNDSLWINDDNKIIETKYLIPRISEEKLLRKIYLESNVISIPGMFMRKSCLDKIGGHNRLLRLTQDLDHHIKFLFKYKCAISDESTVFYRRRADEGNLSHMDSTNLNGQRVELIFVLNNYVNSIKTPEELLKIFPEAIKYGVPKKWSIPYFMGRIALESNINSIKFFGLQLLYNMMSDDANIQRLETEYNFLPKDYMNLIKDNLIFVCSPSEHLKKYKKYKTLFNIMFVLFLCSLGLILCL